MEELLDKKPAHKQSIVLQRSLDRPLTCQRRRPMTVAHLYLSPVAFCRSRPPGQARPMSAVSTDRQARNELLGGCSVGDCVADVGDEDLSRMTDSNSATERPRSYSDCLDKTSSHASHSLHQEQKERKDLREKDRLDLRQKDVGSTPDFVHTFDSRRRRGSEPLVCTSDLGRTPEFVRPRARDFRRTSEFVRQGEENIRRSALPAPSAAGRSPETSSRYQAREEFGGAASRVNGIRGGLRDWTERRLRKS